MRLLCEDKAAACMDWVAPAGLLINLSLTAFRAASEIRESDMMCWSDLMVEMVWVVDQNVLEKTNEQMYCMGERQSCRL